MVSPVPFDVCAAKIFESVGIFSLSLKKEAFQKQQTESQVKDCLHALELILYIFIRNVSQLRLK